MAAADPSNPAEPHRGGAVYLDAPGLSVRLEEEISRAVRQHSALSCLLVRVEGRDTLEREVGARLYEQALAYVAAALGRQLRRFDRIGRERAGELIVVLPGADERRGEIVARRALGRMHAIKLELDGERRSLPVAVGIAAWTEGVGAQELVARARLAALMGNGDEPERRFEHDQTPGAARARRGGAGGAPDGQS